MTDDVSQNKLLSTLSPTESAVVLPRLQYVDLPLNKVICESESPIEYGYFLLRGLLSVVCLMRDGDITEVDTMGRDGLFGGEVLLGHTHQPFRCFVQVPGAGYRIAAAELPRLAVTCPQFYQRLLHYVGISLVQARQSIACNARHRADYRCCRWLLATRDRVGSDTLALSHEFIAQMLGVRRAGVSEILKELRQAGLIEYGRLEIILCDIPGLKERACECYEVIANQIASA
jgi:CRP-like cAMP-binding protein